MSVLDLRIAHYTDEHIEDPRGRVNLPAKEFHHARNLILNACRQFGSVGPMDAYPLAAEPSEAQANRQWKSTAELDPEFFVVDDQLNYERYVYVEVNSSALFSNEWIESVIQSLKHAPGWGVGIANLNDGYLILLENIILVHGPLFEGLKTVETIVDAARRNLR